MTTPPQPPPVGPPPAGGPPAGYANNDEKTWALVSHFGGAAGMLVLAGVGGWVAPLIALISRGNQSATVRQHAVDALNFQLTWSIVGVVGWLTACIGIGFLIILGAALVGIIFGIVGGVRANDGLVYRYPVSLKMVK